MILYICIILFMGVGYYRLLSLYAERWNNIKLSPTNESFATSVTIVIPFRNEAENFTDSSVKVLAANNISLRHKVLNNSLTGKKEALKLAWQHAYGDIVLQTDADCVLPSTWLVSMLHPFAQEKVQLVSGPVDFYATTNFWSKMVRLDFNALIAIGAAHIAWGCYVMVRIWRIVKIFCNHSIIGRIKPVETISI
jgi:poly-beta-1,6-N-acetyl-D-glucosamine synthase